MVRLVDGWVTVTERRVDLCKARATVSPIPVEVFSCSCNLVVNRVTASLQRLLSPLEVLLLLIVEFSRVELNLSLSSTY